MKTIPIETLSREHEGLAVSFDCPAEIGTDAGVLHAIMPDGSKRLLNTELEWRYQGRNDLEGEPNVGLFQHVHTGVWIKMYLDNRLYSGQMIWIEESRTEKLVSDVTKHLESLKDYTGQVEVVVSTSSFDRRTFNR